MYVSMSRLRVAPATAAQLVDAFHARLHAADDATGFLDLQVWQSDREGEMVMVSRWRDRAAFHDYTRSAAHPESETRIALELQAAIKLEQLDHLHTYEIVAQ
jgi:heme-degrading monooxygenase HmoA